MIDSEYSEPIDWLKLFFHFQYPITDKITLYQPYVRDIIDYKDGESTFLFLLYVFVGNTTYFKVFLWDNGVDWNKISDFEMFCDMVRAFTPEQTKLFFGDLNFQNFKKIERQKENGIERLLYDPINDIELTEITYLRIRFYLRHMFDIFPDIEVGIKGKRMKQEIIDYDRKLAKKNSKDGGSYFLSLISTCLNSKGFKYNSQTIKDIGIVELLDSVKRLPHISQCEAVLHGLNGGFVDGSKVKPEQYNFFNDLYKIKRSKSKREQADKVNQEAIKLQNNDTNKNLQKG